MIEKISDDTPKTVNFDLFIRTVAIILEENNKLHDSEMNEEKSDEEYEIQE
jgi:hypothetical protein